jgi:DNA-binding transcriptional MocR family regulator
MGYLISPKKFSEGIQNCKINTDRTTSSLMQRALDLYINDGYWKEHIRNLNKVYKERYLFMESSISENLKNKVLYDSPGGGLNYYFKINENIDINCIKLFNKCRKENVIITPGVLFYKHNIDGDKYFRLGFSKTNMEEIERGIKIISKLLI